MDLRITHVYSVCFRCFEEFITSLNNAYLQFGRGTIRKSRNDNLIRGCPIDQEFKENSPHQHLGLAGSRTCKDLQHAICWANLNHGRLRPFIGKLGSTQGDQYFANNLKIGVSINELLWLNFRCDHPKCLTASRRSLKTAQIQDE